MPTPLKNTLTAPPKALTGVPMRKNPALSALAPETAPSFGVDALHLIPSTRDHIATMLAKDYKNLSWQNNGTAKMALLRALVATGQTEAAEAIMEDYESTPWNGNNQGIKQQMLDALVQIAEFGKSP